MVPDSLQFWGPILLGPERSHGEKDAAQTVDFLDMTLKTVIEFISSDPLHRLEGRFWNENFWNLAYTLECEGALLIFRSVKFRKNMLWISDDFLENCGIYYASYYENVFFIKLSFKRGVTWWGLTKVKKSRNGLLPPKSAIFAKWAELGPNYPRPKELYFLCSMGRYETF